MVLRKPVPHSSLVPAPLSQAAHNPPYPTSPATEQAPSLPTTSSPQQEVYSPNLHESPAFQLKPLDDAQRHHNGGDDESDYSDSDWDKSDEEDNNTPDGLPSTLKIGGGKTIANPAASTLPDALRVGPPGGALSKSQEQLKPETTGATSSSLGGTSTSSKESVPLQTNNPYLRMQSTGQSNFGAESSAQAWGDAPSAAQKYGELVELPAMNTPVEAVSKLSLHSDAPDAKSAFAHNASNGNAPGMHDPIFPSSKQPPSIAVEPETPTTARLREDSNTSSVWDPGMDVSSLDAFARSYGLPSDPPVQEDAPQRTWQEQQAWEKSERERRQQEMAAAHEAAVSVEQERKHEKEWYRLEQEANSKLQEPPPVSPDVGPSLPPRRSQEQDAPPKPPRPTVDASIGGSTARPEPETPNTVVKRQKKEHYQIKHIRWYDARKRGLRESPILTQNANGPCPLLALVNALVLSTPAAEETALVETLRTREQVSLGLLLDAVFDELMSGRRGGAAQELPDVSELYSFLVTLHTGMNVNPMFVRDANTTDGPSALLPDFAVNPGGFENTREMRMYSTFNIPLIHGWLPPSESRAYAAFDRVAKTYEDSQNVQFAEEELEHKLNAGGLDTDEQRLFEDVHAIKEFLNRWPTQLTDYGLHTMVQSLEAGQIGILFRNDHFSTLYKEPRTERILTLVTDSGYSTHDEIVWESLVDINGQGSELYSGDFRPVGNNNPTANSNGNGQQVQSMLDVSDNSEWTTVTSRRRAQQSSTTQETGVTSAQPPPPSGQTSTEQEDHDLALALQLQEEEDDRHRRSLEERRQHENRLSEQAIAANQNRSSQGRRASGVRNENPPLIPPRRNNLPPRPANSNEPAPPPTYEEAASRPAYNPPQGHPASPNAPVRPQGSAYQANSAQLPPGATAQAGRGRNSRPGLIDQVPNRPGRRHSAGVGGIGNDDRDKCVVM